MLAILAAMMLAAAPQHDTVFTADGGRVIGTVVEEGPQGVSVQLVDGTLRRFARRDVVRVEYADGSVSTRRSAEPPPSPSPSPPRAAPPPPYAPAPPQQGYAPPPGYTPPPPPGYAPPRPPPYGPPQYPARPPPAAWAPPRGGPISPFYLSFGLGALGLGGDAESGVRIRHVFDPQVDLAFEGGLRLTPHLALGLYADVGVGDPARDIRDQCNAAGFDCSAETSRVGILLRHTFQPAAPATPWFAVGTGYEVGSVSSGGVEQFRYSGWEILRLVAGYDFRSNQVFGVGLYAGLAFGRYSHYEDLLGSPSVTSETIHTTIEGGLRFTLFP